MGDLDRVKNSGIPEVSHNQEVIAARTHIAGAGEKALGELYVYGNRVFREGTREVAEKTGAIADEQHFQWAASFAQQSTQSFGRALMEIYEDARADIRRSVNQPVTPPQQPALPPSQPARRTPIVEERKLTWGERLSGKTTIVYD